MTAERPARARLVPPAALTVRVLLKTLLFWAFVRAALAGVSSELASRSGVPRAFPELLQPAPLASLGVVAVVLALLWIEMRFQRELLFLDNLGTGWVGTLRVGGALVLLLEAASQVGVRLAGS